MKTGWPPGPLAQDDCRELSRWFSEKLDARRCVRKAAADITEKRMSDDNARAHAISAEATEAIAASLFNTQQPVEPTDAQLLELAMDCDELPVVATSESLLQFARTALARFGTQPSARAEPTDAELARNCGFNAGTIAALAVIYSHDAETIWREVLSAAGEREVLQHAAHVEPEDWKWAGFAAYIKRKPKPLPAPPTGAAA